MISLKNERFRHLYKKLPKNVGDMSKLIVDTGIKKLPKVQ